MSSQNERRAFNSLSYRLITKAPTIPVKPEKLSHPNNEPFSASNGLQAYRKNTENNYRSPLRNALSPPKTYQRSFVGKQSFVSTVTNDSLSYRGNKFLLSTSGSTKQLHKLTQPQPKTIINGTKAKENYFPKQSASLKSLSKDRLQQTFQGSILKEVNRELSSHKHVNIKNLTLNNYPSTLSTEQDSFVVDFNYRVTDINQHLRNIFQIGSSLGEENIKEDDKDNSEMDLTIPEEQIVTDLKNNPYGLRVKKTKLTK